jgi:hypothetical protein
VRETLAFGGRAEPGPRHQLVSTGAIVDGRRSRAKGHQLRSSGEAETGVLRTRLRRDAALHVLTVGLAGLLVVDGGRRVRRRRPRPSLEGEADDGARDLHGRLCARDPRTKCVARACTSGLANRRRRDARTLALARSARQRLGVAQLAISLTRSRIRALRRMSTPDGAGRHAPSSPENGASTLIPHTRNAGAASPLVSGSASDTSWSQ